MQTRKSLLLLAGVIAIVALLAAANVFAESTSCTSKTTTEANGNFIVNVTQQTVDGTTTYVYSVQSPTGKNPNKFFAFVKQGIDGDLVATDLCGIPPCPTGTYVTPHQTSSIFPPPDAWKVVHHQDGVVFSSIAIGHQFQLKVPERYKPEEGVTTILLGIANTYEHCGPILGPTTEAAPSFAGSPVKDIVGHVCFDDGCCYYMTAGATDNIVKEIASDPNTPYETVGCGGIGEPACQACTVTDANCEVELGIVFCPPLELGRPPLQGTPGGTCYSAGKKYPC